MSPRRTKTDKEGTLHLQASGRWAILRRGREPFELTSGDVFRVEVDGKLQVTRMGLKGAKKWNGEAPRTQRRETMGFLFD